MTSEELDQALADQETRIAALTEKVNQRRITRETAAGQIAPPTMGDKLKAALGPISAIPGDIYRGAKDLQSGVSAGMLDKLNYRLGLDTPEQRAQERQENPFSSNVVQGIGSAIGMLTPGAPGNAMGRGVSGLAGMLEQRVPALANTMLGRGAMRAATGAAVTAPLGMSEAAGQGATSPGDILGAGANAGLAGGFLGAGIPIGAGLVGGAARLASRGLGALDPVLGRYGAARAARKYGPGGVSLPASPEEMNAATAETLKKIVGRQGADLSEAGKQWRRTVSGPAAPSPGPGGPGPAEDPWTNAPASPATGAPLVAAADTVPEHTAPDNVLPVSETQIQTPIDTATARLGLGELQQIAREQRKPIPQLSHAHLAGMTPSAFERPAPPPAAAGLDQPIDHPAVTAHLEQAKSKYLNPKTGEPNPGNEAIVHLFDRSIDGLDPKNTVGDLITQRRDIGRAADFLNPNATENSKAARQVYYALREGVHAADKSGNVRTADAAYADAAKQKARGTDILFHTEGNVTGQTGQGDVGNIDERGAAMVEGDEELARQAGAPSSMRVGREDQAMALLRRVGDRDPAGIQANYRLQELGTHGHTGDLADLQAQKDYLATRFKSPHLGQHLGGIAAGTEVAHQFGMPHALPMGIALGGARAIVPNLRAFGAAGIDAGHGVANLAGRPMPGWINEFEQLYAQARARAQAEEEQRRQRAGR